MTSRTPEHSPTANRKASSAMNKTTLLTVISLLFIASGITGLIYQVVWFKYFSLFLGNTTYAQTIVVATFMGGLALGNAYFGRRIDISKIRPFLLYGILEFGIAIYCIAFPQLYQMLRTGFSGLVLGLGLEVGSVPVLLLKFLFGFLGLIVPTFFMGGTLPILVKEISGIGSETGRSVALLYFLNSFGAVFGALFAGFFFIRVLGIQTTLYLNVIINFLLAVTAIIVAQFSQRTVEPAVEEQAVGSSSFTPRHAMIALIVAGLSGMASMIFEITWVRMLVPVFGSSTYSFSLMLIAFISGITLGSLIVSQRVNGFKDPLKVLLWCQTGIAAAMLLSLPLYGTIPYVFWKISALFDHSSSTYPFFLLIELQIVFVIMVIPTTLFGMSLPIAAHISSGAYSSLGRNIGNIFSINTIGAVIGTVAAGFLLIPLLGLQRTVELGILLCTGTALLVLFAFFQGKERRNVAIVLAVCWAGYIGIGSDWNKLINYSGVFRHVTGNFEPPKSFREFVEKSFANNTIYYKEGASATVAVVEAEVRGEIQRILLVNGKSDATSGSDMPTQSLLAQLPLLFHPQPETVLVIGYGSGVTVGSVLTHPIKYVESVEISGEVIEASHAFDHVNERPFDDPRFTIFQEDALVHLDLSPYKYDIIISEPSNPWIAGIGNLFTIDYFKNVKKRLKPGGIMVQWFQLYEMDDQLLRLVMRTFAQEFRHISLWNPVQNDLIMIGSDEPFTPDFEQIRSRFASPKVNAHFKKLGINTLPVLFSVQALSTQSVREYAGYGLVNTQDHPILEYDAPRAFYVSSKGTRMQEVDERLVGFYNDLLLSQYTARYPLTFDEKTEIARYHHDGLRGSPYLAYGLLKELSDQRPKDKEVASLFLATTELLQRSTEALDIKKRLAEGSPRDASVLSSYALALFRQNRMRSTVLSKYDFSVEKELLQRCVALAKDTTEFYRVLLGDLYLELRRYDDAISEYKKGIDIRTNNTHYSGMPIAMLYMKAGRALSLKGDLGPALKMAIQAGVEAPDNEEIRDLIYFIVQSQLEQANHDRK